ncbi:probable serine/threonine-protein kinase vps15 isoform X2 [Ananas comosus]|uniref:non-specific serine/threonine protein kinase n=1 Tax=Ananas comosus TaxID=4615 RepID=A0A6P5H1I5_ANACO|nr:probable serine/threonine-protein kinase vps15 isoform X2 [Ananas comosus]
MIGSAHDPSLVSLRRNGLLFRCGCGLSSFVMQLLCAVEQTHSKGVCHGDIKCENVLVTSWNWLYLADFASFKPTYIPDDDPSDFSFFFDTGGRRRCYLAPERFYEHGGETQVAPDSPLKPSMDIFSLGCVIAELFLEGQPLFELSQLLAYRRGQYDPSLYLEKIQDVGIRRMILHMIQLDPESRLSCESYLQSYVSEIFPSYFSPFLHKFFSCMIPLDSDTRVDATQRAFETIHKQMMLKSSIEENTADSCTGPEISNIESSELIKGGMHRMNSPKRKGDIEKGTTSGQIQIVGDINSLLKEVEEGDHSSRVNLTQKDVQYASSQPLNYLRKQVLSCFKGQRENEAPIFRKMLKSDLDSLMVGYDRQTDTYNMPFLFGTENKTNKTSCEGMVLIASLLCSCIRSVKQPQLRRAGLIVLKTAALYIDDEDRLQHVVPYVIAMLSDPAAIVRCAAVETLCDILALVQDFPPSDAMIFPEYILPMLSMLPDDPEESVRICYASNIYKIAFTAYRFLIHAHNLADGGSLDKLSLAKKKHQSKSGSELFKLRKSIAEIVQELVMGPKQTPSIRRALLQDISYLCYFFGHRQCNDFLLPILPAFLNDRDEQLREVFYGQIVFVCYFVGQVSVEEYLLPYIEQALSDDMEAVIVNALDCLSMLCKSGFLRKRILLGLIEKALPLLCYPIQWVRRSAVKFIAASSESLGPIDTYVYLSPVLHPFLHREPSSLCSPESLLSCLKPPVSKLVFYQVLENARSSDTLERQRKVWYNNSTALLNQWETIEHSKKDVGDAHSLNTALGKEPIGQSGKYSGRAAQSASFGVIEDVAKTRAANSFHNRLVDVKDSLSSDKLQVSGFMPLHVTAGNGSCNNSFFDGVSEGIPIYSVCVDKNSSPNLKTKGATSLCVPWLEPTNKPLSLSASVPPRLISGSFYNMNANANSVQKPKKYLEESETDQSSYVTSKFQEVTIYDTIKGSSSTTGDDPSQSDSTGLPSFSRGVPDTGWRPRGVLVAHLQEHRSAVNDIAASNDDSFFVSASDDSTVKIWDTRKLEKDISFRSRLTYPLGGSRALCATMLRGTARVVVGASDGMLHLFSVDYISRGMGSVIERYTGVADVKKKDIGEGAILSLLNCSTNDSFVSQTVLFSTQHCAIHLWDTRAKTEAWNFKALPDEGYISSLVMGQCGNWFVSGSSRGVLTLWDLRFLLPVNSWQYSTTCPVEKLCLLIPSSNSLSLMAQPLVYVAAGCNEVSLWNAENGSCHQVFRTAGSGNEAEISNVPRALVRPTTKLSAKQDVKRINSSKYRIDELNEPSPRLPGIRSLLPLPGGDLLTGGPDLRIRYWDHTSPTQSYCVCGPSIVEIGTGDLKEKEQDKSYDVKSSFGVQVVQELNKWPLSANLQKNLLAMAAADSAGCHRDSVLSLASVKLNQRMLISSSRDGAIKVWK